MCIIWTLGVLTLWIQAYVLMENSGRTDVAGSYKAVLELAESMNTQLLEPIETDHKVLLDLPETTLSHRITERLHGGSIGYSSPLLISRVKSRGTKRREVFRLVKQNIWWVLVTLASLSFSVWTLAEVPYLFSWTVVGLASSLVLSSFIGVHGKSRAILFFWLFISLCIIPFTITFPILSHKRVNNGIYLWWYGLDNPQRH
jgi:hypothetical protein